MEMTHEDIVASYRQAKNKSTQIGVLADLNLTDKESIRAVLIDAGELPPDKAEKKPLPESNEDIATVIRESLEAGLTQTETAKLAGVCQATVGRYAREHGLGKRKRSRRSPPPPRHRSRKGRCLIPSCRQIRCPSWTPGNRVRCMAELSPSSALCPKTRMSTPKTARLISACSFSAVICSSV